MSDNCNNFGLALDGRHQQYRVFPDKLVDIQRVLLGFTSGLVYRQDEYQRGVLEEDTSFGRVDCFHALVNKGRSE